MKIKSPLLQQATGRIGGLSIQMNSGAPTLGTLGRPRGTPTTFQIGQRRTLADLRKLWRDGLTDAQRSAWTAWAASAARQVGRVNKQSESGFQAFFRLNANRLLVFTSYLTAPPTTFANPLFRVASAKHDLFFDRTVLALNTSDPWQAATGNYVLLWVSRPQSPTSSTQPKHFRFAGSLRSSAFIGPFPFAFMPNPWPLPSPCRYYARPLLMLATGGTTGIGSFRIEV